MAHIAAAEDGGPRANQDLTDEERGAFENLILLCANCHTRVDKAPTAYTDALIKNWKRDHQHRLDAAFGVAQFPNRQAARGALEPLMDENRLVFERFGPVGRGHDDPESELATAWERKVLATILPNLNLMLRILDTNRKLLTEVELEIVASLRQHVDDLTLRHTSDEPFLCGSTYPPGMDAILEQV